MARNDFELWLLRGVWLVMPFTVGAPIGVALADSPRGAQVGLTLGAWLIWAATLVVMMVPRTWSLTWLRIIVPAVVPVTLWAVLDTGDLDAAAISAGIVAAVATGLALRATIADVMVDGSSYGDESRFLLSTPGALLLGPLFAFWALMVGASLIGLVAVFHQRWVVGLIALAVGAAAFRIGVPVFERLSNRWLVFVPAGVVLHDKTALREPQLFDHLSVAAFGPAPADTSAHDLTLGALGLALRVHLVEPSKIVENARQETLDLTEIEGFIFSPNRPGAVVAEANRRGIRLG